MQPASQTIASGTTSDAERDGGWHGPAQRTSWYIGTSGTTTNPIAGATASSYTTPPLTATTSYWVQVSNAGGAADSNTATITVLIPPTITIQPTSQTVTGGTEPAVHGGRERDTGADLSVAGLDRVACGRTCRMARLTVA